MPGQRPKITCSRDLRSPRESKRATTHERPRNRNGRGRGMSRPAPTTIRDAGLPWR